MLLLYIYIVYTVYDMLYKCNSIYIIYNMCVYISLYIYKEILVVVTF